MPNLSDYLTPLRIATGDQPIEGTTERTDAELIAAMQALFTMGLAPRCITAASDGSLTPDPNADAVGIIVLKTALLLQGAFAPPNIRTRGLSITQSAGDRRDTITMLRNLVLDLEQKGDPCNEGGASFFGSVHDINTTLIGKFTYLNTVGNDPTLL